MAPEIFPNPAKYLNDKRWQIKVYDNEVPYEPPHFNVLYKMKRSRKCWRIDLETLEPMDLTPPKADLPDEFVDHIEENARDLRRAWNKTHPCRPVDLESGESVDRGLNKSD